VFNIAYKFTGKHDEAEDLTQDIFLKIFKSLHTFDRRANFQTWLVSVSAQPLHRPLSQRPQGARNHRPRCGRG
jgi:RNA polymerase sigma factor (sigma-70 family)